MIAAFLRLVRDFLCSSVANLWTFFKLALLERRLTASHGEDASEVNAVLYALFHPRLLQIRVIHQKCTAEAATPACRALYSG